MNCKLGAIRLIDDMLQILSKIEERDYNLALEVYNQSTLGKHFRHIYDFFNCLIIQAANPEIDYCFRSRDPKIEEDIHFAKEAFTQLKYKLTDLDESRQIRVHADFEIGDGERPVVSTTLGREIMYAYDHAVHHLAIVKIGLKVLYPDQKINESLGVAASTIRHQHAVEHS